MVIYESQWQTARVVLLFSQMPPSVPDNAMSICGLWVIESHSEACVNAMPAVLIDRTLAFVFTYLQVGGKRGFLDVCIMTRRLPSVDCH